MKCQIFGSIRKTMCLEPDRCAWARFCENILEIEKRLDNLEVRKVGGDLKIPTNVGD